MADDLWGDINIDEAGQTPLSLVKEQAHLISKKTGGVLTGVVSTSTAQGTGLLTVEFRIIAPALNNFGLSLLRINHPITIWPVVYFDTVNERPPLRLADLEGLKHAIGQTLQSTKVKNAVSGLVIQSREATART